MISFLRSATSSQVRHDMLLLGGLGAIAFAVVAAWVWRTPMEWPPEDYGTSSGWILRTVSPIFVVGGVYIFIKYL